MAGAGIFSTTVLLLLLAVAVFTSDASDSVTAAVEATDSAGTEETSNLQPVHHINGDKETMHKLAKAGGPSGDGAENLASTEQHGKMVGSDWGKAKKMDDDDDDKGDSDHNHDSDSDHDQDSDHDSDSDHDHDSDHDSDSDDSDHDSDSNSHDDDGDSAYRT